MRWTFAAVAACLLAPAAAVAVDAAPPCDELGFSPSFGRDRTVFCLLVTEEGVSVRRSGDGAVSWGGAVRLPSADATSAALYVSPLYPTDRSVFVVASDAVYGSTDSGRTFAVVTRRPWDATVRPGTLTPYVESAVTGTRRAAFVVADGGYGGARVLDTATGLRPVVGAPAFTRQFVVPPEFASSRTAYAIGSQVGVYRGDEPVTDVGTHVYACAGDFTCARKVFTFGRVGHSASGPLGRPGDVFYGGTVLPNDGPPTQRSPERIWHSRDGGGTWTRWTSAERVVNARRGPGGWGYSVTASPDAPRRLFLSVARFGASGRATDAAFRLYRSDDDGATWRTASSRLPWNAPRRGRFEATVYAQPGGRLFALARRVVGRTDYAGMFCSRDLGRSWRAGRC